MNRLSLLIATTLGTGFSPLGPGTVGSAVALAMYWLIPGLRGFVLLSVIVVLFILGVWASGRVEKSRGHDAPCINIDEVVGMGIALAFFPEGLSGFLGLVPFVLFRLFDVWKPSVVGHSQKLPGGWGVMTDDVLAGLAAGGCFRLGLWVVQTWLS